MQMTFRWYGQGNDQISLEMIKQIPDVKGIVWSLHDEQAGAEWSMDKIMATKKYIEDRGFNIDVVESVNVHEDIKLGLPSRDEYIENYNKTIRKLGKAGVKVICYNFMPVFDWTRTDLFHPLPDGSNALFFEKAKTLGSPDEIIKKTLEGVGKMTMPGWEPERLAKIEKSFELYKEVDSEKLWSNLKYFLDAVIPVAKESGIKMAIHPDDPPWPIFGLPRIITSEENIDRFLKLHDDEHNGLTLCTGSLGPNPKNDLPQIIRRFGSRIHFAHIRNVKIFENGDFIESSHKSSHGNVDIAEVVKAYYEIGYKGYIRPDHGRHLWGEEKTCRPGYGLYDRALGIMYIWGLWDAYSKSM